MVVTYNSPESALSKLLEPPAMQCHDCCLWLVTKKLTSVYGSQMPMEAVMLVYAIPMA